MVVGDFVEGHCTWVTDSIETRKGSRLMESRPEMNLGVSSSTLDFCLLTGDKICSTGSSILSKPTSREARRRPWIWIRYRHAILGISSDLQKNTWVGGNSTIIPQRIFVLNWLPLYSYLFPDSLKFYSTITNYWTSSNRMLKQPVWLQELLKLHLFAVPQKKSSFIIVETFVSFHNTHGCCKSKLE